MDNEMVAAARELYVAYGGVKHEEIEKEMKRLGWDGFHRGLFYKHERSGRKVDGWPKALGWKKLLPAKSRGKKDELKTQTRDPFAAWLRTVFTQMTWRWRYQTHLYKALARVTSGKSKRLMIFMPPRHGKSETVTVRYTAWRLLREPKLNVILGSYNQRLADRFSRKIQRVFHDPASRTVGRRDKGEFPSLPVLETVSKRSTAIAEWETGGGGAVRSVGVGAGIAGFGAGLIVIDDPVRNRQDAESETFRDRVWDWFNDDIYTRLEPDAAIILIQTRWHEDDLAGRLLREAEEEGGEKWDVINLPAIAQENDQIGRKPGEALCPARYDVKALERIKKKLGSYSFSALYQQDPVPATAGLFKREWFRNVIDKAPENLRWKRGYDLAVSVKTSADFTASFRCAYGDDGNLYIADGHRVKIEFPDQRRFIIDRMREEMDTEHGIEASMTGKAIVQELRRERGIRSFAFREVEVSGDKLTRALAWLNLAESGKLIMIRGPWIDAFVDEIARFPSGKHDDQIDAVSVAVSMMTLQRYRSGGF